MKILETALQHVNQPIVSVRVSRHQKEAVAKHKVSCIADQALDHLVVVEIHANPKPRSYRGILMKVQSLVTFITVEGLDEEHSLGILRRDLFNCLCPQKLQPYRLKGMLIVLQQFFNRPQFARLRSPPESPLFEPDDNFVGTFWFWSPFTGLRSYEARFGGLRSYCLIL